MPSGVHNNYPKGKQHSQWKGGICDDIKAYMKKYRQKHRKRATLLQKNLRHKKGISKRYNFATTGIHLVTNSSQKITKKVRARLLKEWRKKNPLKVKAYKHRRRYNKKNAGKLTIKTIQLIYEDNIKKFGTLTCYLCEKQIQFGKDNLEHKTPLFRGGTNDYNNLAVACKICNCKKYTKTELEYHNSRKEVLK